MDENIAANWDLYMITILTLLLGIIMYMRRPFPQPDQPAQQPAADEIAAAPVNLAPVGAEAAGVSPRLPMPAMQSASHFWASFIWKEASKLRPTMTLHLRWK